MGDERDDDAERRARADVYSSARIGAAAALTIVLGVTDYSFALTTHAKAHGWHAAFDAGVVSSSISQYGRGERSIGRTIQLSTRIGPQPVTSILSVDRSSEIA